MRFAFGPGATLTRSSGSREPAFGCDSAGSRLPPQRRHPRRDLLMTFDTRADTTALNRHIKDP